MGSVPYESCVPVVFGFTNVLTCCGHETTCFLQTVFDFTLKKANVRTFGEHCSVKSHGADIFHPRSDIELSKNTKIPKIAIFLCV